MPIVSLADVERTWVAELSDPWRGDPRAPLELPSVRRCALGGSTLVSWPRGRLGVPGTEFKLSRLLCGSYRCPRCAYGGAMQDLRRIQTGVTSRPFWIYCVLTVDRKDWRDPWEVYRSAGALWDRRLRGMLRRRFGRVEYVQTWEAHRSGWPHLNLLMTAPSLKADVELYPQEFREVESHGRKRMAHWTGWRSRRRGKTERTAGKLDTWSSWVERCGFGAYKWVEIVDSPEGVACYLAKVAREIAATMWKEGDQRPLNAPPHFRRIRASKGLLPTAKEAIRWDPIRGWYTPTPAEEGQWEGVVLNRKFEDVDPAGISWTDLSSLIARRQGA